jgi:ATP-binding cassette, subfamily B, bacterial MsbA
LQFYVFLAAIADPVRKLSSVNAKLQAAEAAGARVFEVYDREPRVEANPSGPRLTDVTKRIEFRHVCFAYNPAAETPTLDNVSFTVKAGETIAVVGGNGCGKTTLLSLLPRFFDPDSGAVLIDGVNLRTAHLRSLRKLIGVVTQDTQLFDDTVFANIAYGRPGATREEVIEAAKKARAHAFIEKKEGGYDALLGVAGSNFAGGERQKIALARAILRDPSILILDEFTSAVDAQSELDIHATLKEFVKGRTTFLITHKIHTVPEIADRVVMMDAGRVLDVGTHAELLGRCDAYRRLFESAQSWRQEATGAPETKPEAQPAPAVAGTEGSIAPPPLAAVSKPPAATSPSRGEVKAERGAALSLTSPLEGEVAGTAAVPAGGGGEPTLQTKPVLAPEQQAKPLPETSGRGESTPQTIPVPSAPEPQTKPLPEKRDAA